MLRIAVQSKGRLFEETSTMLAESSIKVDGGKRTLLVKAKNFPVETFRHPFRLYRATCGHEIQETLSRQAEAGEGAGSR